MKRERTVAPAMRCRLCGKPSDVQVELSYPHPKYGIVVLLCCDCAPIVRKEILRR